MEIPIGAGRSSFELIDFNLLFGELHLEKGMVFLDLACGKGLYAIAAAEAVGVEGQVRAIDLWEEGITHLEQQAAARNLTHIKSTVGDVSREIPLSSGSVDTCLMATVLHDFVRMGAAEKVLGETRRVLNSRGTLAIVEFKKVEGPPGPPIHVRLDPEEVERMVSARGFSRKRFVDLGPYNYLITFSLKELLEGD